MKTFRTAVISLLLIAGVLVTTSTANAKQPPVVHRAESWPTQPVVTLEDHAYRATTFKGGKLLLKRVGADGTRISVVVDPKGSSVVYSWSAIAKFADWLFGSSPTTSGPDKSTTCTWSTTTVKTRTGPRSRPRRKRATVLSSSPAP